MKKFPHKKTQKEYAAEKEAEEVERRKAISMGDNEAVEDNEGSFGQQNKFFDH